MDVIPLVTESLERQVEMLKLHGEICRQVKRRHVVPVVGMGAGNRLGFDFAQGLFVLLLLGNAALFFRDELAGGSLIMLPFASTPVFGTCPISRRALVWLKAWELKK